MYSASSSLGRLALRFGHAAPESNFAECSYRPRLTQLTGSVSPSHFKTRGHAVSNRSATLSSCLCNERQVQAPARTQRRYMAKRYYSSHDPRPHQHAPSDALVFLPAPQPAPNSSIQEVSSSLASIQSAIQIPSEVLLDVLTTKDKSYYQLLRSRLPPDFHRLDAYLLLRSQDPASLGGLAEMDIDRLIKRAGKEGLAGVLSLLLVDIVGSPSEVANAHAGYFRISPATHTRYNLLKTLLINCNRDDLLQDDAMALHLFQLFVSDFKALSDPTTSTQSSVPSNFPQGDARNLVKRILHIQSAELAPVLQALCLHLEHRTTNFPSAREASQLLEYYLQPSTRDFAAALDVVRTLKDTHGLSQDAIDQAVQDGRSYFNQLTATPGKLKPDQDINLEQICLEVSLRLVSMKCFMVQHPEGGAQYLSVVQNLMRSFRLDMLPDSAIFAAASSPGVTAFRLFRNILFHLLGQPGVDSIRHVLAMLQTCDARLLAMLSSRDVQEICDLATARQSTSVSVQAYFLVIKAKARVAPVDGKASPYAHSLVRDGFLVNTDTFISLLQELNSSGKSLSTSAIVRGLRLLPLSTTSLAQIHQRFKGVQRASFIGALAGAGMKKEAFELFQLWSDAYYDSDTARALVPAPIGDTYHKNTRLERQYGLLKEEVNHVASSSSCLLALVKSLCRGSLPRVVDQGRNSISNRLFTDAEENVHQAKFAIEVFKNSHDPIDWTHHHLTALATACFYVRDIPGAFTALARISFMRHLPDSVDISVMIGGLMAIDPDKAVELFISHSTYVEHIDLKAQTPPRQRDIPAIETAKHEDQADEDSPGLRYAQATETAEHENKMREDEELIATGTIPKIERRRSSAATKAIISPMRPSAKLASTLLSRAMSQGRFDLVNKLVDFAREAGISSQLGLAASTSLLTQANMSPSGVVKVVKRLVRSGWPADPGFLESAARQILGRHSLNLSQANEKESDAETEAEKTLTKIKAATPFERLSSVKTAVYLMEVSLAAKNLVNLQTVKFALSKIRNSGSQYLPRKSVAEGEVKKLASIRADPRANWIACIDRIVYALRWADYFDTGHDYRQGLPLWKSRKTVEGGFVSVDLDDLYNLAFTPSATRAMQDQKSVAMTPEIPSTELTLADHGANAQVSQRQPNVLPSHFYRRILEAYLAWGDTQGAVEVAAWMRDEAGKDIGHTSKEVDDFVNRIKTALDKQQERQSRLSGAAQSSQVSNEIWAMLSGQQTTTRLKGWWIYRG